MSTDKFTQDYNCLNKIQKEIINNFVSSNSDFLVNSGPGTGKTRTIAVLLGYLLLNQKYKLDEILALTFSNKAANELRERVFSYFSKSFSECYITTFHSFCAKLVREYFWVVDVNPNFKLLDNFKEALLFFEICKNISEDELTANNIKIFKPVITKRSFQSEVLRFIALLKSNLISPSDLFNALEKDKHISNLLRQKYLELLKIYNIYNSKLKELNYLDFRDLISLGIKIVERVDRISEKFKLIIVDEFQDTDPAQFYLLSLLKKKSNCKVIAIGDPMQCIYRFRGSNPTIMEDNGDYIKIFKPKVYNLNINYRNSPKILELANKIGKTRLVGVYEYDTNKIATYSSSSTTFNQELTNNLKVNDKSSEISEGIVELHSLPDEFAEARFIADYIANIVINQKPSNFELSEIAILVRNNYQIDVIAEALRSKKVPYQISADMKFFQSEEVNGIVALLKALTAEDIEEKNDFLKRALCSPLFGIDSLWLNDKILENEESNKNFYNIMMKIVELYQNSNNNDNHKNDQYENENSRKIFELAKICFDFKLDKAKNVTLQEILQKLFMHYRAIFDDINHKFSKNLLHFYKMVFEFTEVWKALYKKEPYLTEFVLYIDEFLPFYASTLEEEETITNKNSVRIMTIHQSKGLEFSVVFVPGLCQSVFPPDTIEDKLLGTEGIKKLREIIKNSKKQITFFNPYPEDYEELLKDEKRLYYVAVTRAKSILILTYPRSIYNETVLMAPFILKTSVPYFEHKIYSFFDQENILSLSDLKIKLATLPREFLSKFFDSYANNKTLDENYKNFIAILSPIKVTHSKTDRVILPKDFKFSTTAIEAYLECPRKFYFRHVLKVRPLSEIKQPKMLLGRAIHKCLKYLHDNENRLDIWNIKDENNLNSIVSDIWNNIGKSEIENIRPILIRSFNKKACEYLKNYIRAVFINKQLGVWKNSIGETYFRFNLDGKYRHVCVGFFDRLHFMSNNAILIVDYKISSEKSSKILLNKALKKVENEKYELGYKIQSLFYLLAIIKGANVFYNEKQNLSEIDKNQTISSAENLATFVKFSSDVSFINLFVASELYKKKTQNFQVGYLKSAAINYFSDGSFNNNVTLPAWGEVISKVELEKFESLLTNLLDSIKEDSTFPCKPSEDSDAYTCRSANYNNNDCEYATFCQDILDQY